MRIEFELPWPVSVNQYYRHVGPRVLISRDGKKFRELVIAIVAEKNPPKFKGNVAIYATFYPPDRRRRDIDNVGGKALLDSLQAAGLFDDDSQVKLLHLEMHEPMENGLCAIRIEDLNYAKN